MADEQKDSLSSLQINRGNSGSSVSLKKKPIRSRKSRIIIGGFALLILMIALFNIFGTAKTVRTTSVTQVYPSQALHVLIASGYVVAQRKADVASKATGRLIELLVVEGDVVKQGGMLARIENNDVEAALAQVKANLEQTRAALLQAKAEEQDATSAYQRSKSLVDAGSVSKAEFDIAEARYKRAVAGVKVAESNIKAAEATVRAAQVQVENTFIRAPFTGTVLTKNADVGEVVAPLGAGTNSKAAVVSMADMSSLEVEVDVSESQIEKVTVGQPCEISLDAYPGQRYRGAVAKIVPTADRSKATVLVKIRFLDLDKRVLPEMSAKVAFLSREISKSEIQDKPKLCLDAKAIVKENGTMYVWIVQDGVLQKQKISTGEKIGDLIDIATGIRVGDKVVINPADDLEEGKHVTIEKE